MRHKSFKINPYKKRLESMKETRSFLHNIFKLTDLSSQRKRWKKKTDSASHAKSILIFVLRKKCLRGKDRRAELSLN